MKAPFPTVERSGKAAGNTGARRSSILLNQFNHKKFTFNTNLLQEAGTSDKAHFTLTSTSACAILGFCQTASSPLAHQNGLVEHVRSQLASTRYSRFISPRAFSTPTLLLRFRFRANSYALKVNPE